MSWLQPSQHTPSRKADGQRSGGKKAFPRRSKGMLSKSLFQGQKDRRMTLSAMVARPTGRNWVRADRFGGRCKAFLCPRSPLPASTAATRAIRHSAEFFRQRRSMVPVLSPNCPEPILDITWFAQPRRPGSGVTGRAELPAPSGAVLFSRKASVRAFWRVF